MARLPPKELILLTLSILLSGCATTTVPVVRTFPTVPDELLNECPALSTIGKPEVKLSELLETVNKNYSKYHSCSEITSAWQDWYREQKKAFDSVK